MSNVNQMLLVGIQFPYLEMRKFTDKWKKCDGEKSEKGKRYDLYARYAFNCLAGVVDESWDAIKRMKGKNKPSVSELVGSRIDYPGILDTHRAWWLSGCRGGYSDVMVAFCDYFYNEGADRPKAAKPKAPAKPRAAKPAKGAD
jgi:hypothetical protein